VRVGIICSFTVVAKYPKEEEDCGWLTESFLVKVEAQQVLESVQNKIKLELNITCTSCSQPLPGRTFVLFSVHSIHGSCFKVFIVTVRVTVAVRFCSCVYLGAIVSHLLLSSAGPTILYKFASHKCCLENSLYNVISLRDSVL
jgi:hypothetical protein